MPNFTWNVTPVAFELPRNPVLVLLALIAISMLVSGLRNKQGDSTLFGVIMTGLLAVAWKYLPDPLEIRWYSLLFVGVFLGGYSLLNWQVRRGGGGVDTAGDFIVYGVLGVLLGARLGHVLFYDLDHALRDPAWVIQIWTGGLASHGAVVGLILAMYLFTRSRGVPFLEGADRFSFSAALGATLVRLGNFFNSEIVGRKTDGTWGVRFPHFTEDGPNPALRHPSQLYEVCLGLAVLLALYLADKKLGKEKRPRGALISIFFTLYFAGRFGVEFFKEYQALEETTNALTMGQYLSIPGFLLGVYGLYWSFTTKEPSGWPSDEDEDEDEDEDAAEENEEQEPDDSDRDDASDEDEDDSDGDDAADEDDSDDSDDSDATEDDDERPRGRKAAKGGGKKKNRRDPDVDEEFGD